MKNFHFKVRYAFLLAFLYFSQPSLFGQQILVPKDHILFDNLFLKSPTVDSIETFNESFDGFLLIKIDSSYKKESGIFRTKIFWADSLSAFQMGSYINYYPFVSLLMGKSGAFPEDGSLDAQSRIFCKTWFLMNRYSDCHTFLYESNVLNTNILKDQIVWNYLDSYYVIFECFFNTAVGIVIVNDLDAKQFRKVYIPISPLGKLDSANEETCYKNNFKNSGMKVKLITE